MKSKASPNQLITFARCLREPLPIKYRDLPPDAYRLLGSRSIQSNDRDAAIFEIFENLTLEGPKFLTNRIQVAAQVLVEAVLPLVQIKDLRRP